MNNTDRTPYPYRKYKHFKGNLYQVLCIADHSETGEKMVVYQALYGDYRIFVRPLDMFLEPVDRVKYPDATQEYRFEPVSDNSTHIPDNKAEADSEFHLDPDVERFLDSDTYEERVEILTSMEDRITDEMIDIMSATIDIEVAEGPVRKRYSRFLDALNMRRHYEAHRLRN